MEAQCFLKEPICTISELDDTRVDRIFYDFLSQLYWYFLSALSVFFPELFLRITQVILCIIESFHDGIISDDTPERLI